MTLDLASDMDGVFLVSGFEEMVKYNSADPANDSDYVSIPAIVYRDTEASVNINKGGGNFNQAMHYDTQVYVSKTDVPTVRVNADKVQLKAQLGDESDKTFTVSKIIRMDAGAYRLGLL